MGGSADPLGTEAIGSALSRADTSHVAVDTDGTSGDEVVSRDSLDKGGTEGHDGEEGGEVHICWSSGGGEVVIEARGCIRMYKNERRRAD